MTTCAQACATHSGSGCPDEPGSDERRAREGRTDRQAVVWAVIVSVGVRVVGSPAWPAAVGCRAPGAVSPVCQHSRSTDRPCGRGRDPTIRPATDQVTAIVTPATEDEMRWAEAQSILDGAPTESAKRRLRRSRQLAGLFVAAVLLLCTVAAVVLFVFAHGTFDAEPSQVPTWQTAMGYTIAVAGLLLQAFGVVTTWRNNRRLRAWSSPWAALTRRERKEVLAQVRGLQPIEPERLPLARHLAEHLVSQRAGLVANVGLGIAFTGHWIASPALWRGVLAFGYGLVLPVAWAFVQRDARRARRFLEAHLSSAGSGTEA